MDQAGQLCLQPWECSDFPLCFWTLPDQAGHTPSIHLYHAYSSADDAYIAFAKQSGLTNILYSLQNTCSVIWEIIIFLISAINAAPVQAEQFVQQYKMLL